jgi:hypothetical protein
MREYLEIYTEHQKKIENFIEDSIEKFPSLSSLEEENFKKLFNTFPSLELVYVVNSATKKQTSANCNHSPTH